MFALTKPASRHKPLYILLATVLVVGVLLTPVDAFRSAGVSFIDTELRAASTANKQFVNTKYPIGDAEQLAAFPKEFGTYKMRYQYEWDFLAELLDTDVLMARDYGGPGLFLPVTLLIVQSTNMSSFHPAPVCFKAQGWTINESSTAVVDIPVDDAAWARQGVLEGDQHAFDGTIQAKRLLAEREVNGSKQRELNLYFYIKEESNGVATKVSWIRVSMFVPATGDYTAHENILKNFTAQIVPELFAPEPRTTSQTVLGRVIEAVRA